MENEKEIVFKTRVTNEQILEQINGLTSVVNSLIGTIDEMKTKIGFNDKPMSKPFNKNENSDPGPWAKKAQVVG